MKRFRVLESMDSFSIQKPFLGLLVAILNVSWNLQQTHRRENNPLLKYFWVGNDKPG